MRKWMCGLAVAVLTAFAPCVAYATQADEATFTLKAGSPPADPNPVQINELTNISFSAELYAKSDSNQEQPAKKVKSQSYTISVGTDGIIVNASNGFVISADKHSATYSKTGGNEGVELLCLPLSTGQ